MREPSWDTRSPVGTRPGGRDRLVLGVGVALPAVAILAAVTGKVFASHPPALPDSSPAADHIERSAPNLPLSKPPDPRGLFLDLPDPPEPPVPPISEPPGRDSDSQDSAAVASRGATSSVSFAEKKAPVARGRAGSAAARSAKSAGVVPDVPAVEPGSGMARDLLEDPDCRFSDVARRDLEAGIVDEYLISALQAVCREHSIYVNVFKTGHTFGAGLAEGPTIPIGYGNAGGYPNTHYFGRGADIWEVDGKPVEGNGADPDVVSVGRILAGLPSRNKPDVVIGPAAWNQALGYGPAQGWVLDPNQVFLHDDHLHIGYWHGDGTPPPQLFLSTDHHHELSSANGGEARLPTVRSYVRDSDSTADRPGRRPSPKLKETIEPAVNPPTNARSERAPGEKKRNREKPTPQEVVERRTQPPDPQGPGPQKPGLQRPKPETPQKPRTREPVLDRQPEPDVQQPP